MSYKVVVDFRRGPAWTTTLSATDEGHAEQMARALAPEYGFDQPIVKVKVSPANVVWG